MSKYNGKSQNARITEALKNSLFLSAQTPKFTEKPKASNSLFRDFLKVKRYELKEHNDDY